MRPEYILEIRGEATRSPFYNNFLDAFGWRLDDKDFGLGKSIRFVKGNFGEIAQQFEDELKTTDPAYFTSIVALLSAEGEARDTSDKGFYRDAEAIRRLPFEFKADFLCSNLLENIPGGFVSWLGQRHIVMDEPCFLHVKSFLESKGVSVATEKAG